MVVYSRPAEEEALSQEMQVTYKMENTGKYISF